MHLDYELVEVEWRNGETRTEEFLDLNPRGQVPVLDDEGEIIWDSQAILVYLAHRYDPRWLPFESLKLAQVMQWLAVSENEILYGPGWARGAKLYDIELNNLDDILDMSRTALAVVEQRLAKEEWLAASQPTVADIACFPYITLCEQGGFELDEYPATSCWINRIKSLEGFVGMEGVAPLK